MKSIGLIFFIFEIGVETSQADCDDQMLITSQQSEAWQAPDSLCALGRG